ncbi:MAG: NHL repeat-containing protein [Candidatus Latescibacterota bacterium]
MPGICSLLFLFLISPCIVFAQPGTIYKNTPLAGKMAEAKFYEGDSNYHAIVHASDGFVYYAICTHNRDRHVNLFRYDPKTGEVRTVADIGKTLGEDGTKNIPQGKVHCDIFEHDGKLWFGTHVGLYGRGGLQDHGPYPGGHFLSWDLKTGKLADLGIGAPEEGLVALSLDTARGRLYALTWPSAIFIYYDIKSGQKKSFGPSVVGHSYVNTIETGGVPRSLAVDPRDGNVYWFNMDETVSCYRYTTDKVELVKDQSFAKPILKVRERGNPDDNASWRSIRWSEALKRFVGVTFYGEHLFSWDPKSGEMEVIDRIAMGPTRKSGELMRGSLAFELSPDGGTVYYVNGASPGFEGNKKTVPDLVHLVAYDLRQRRYTDHGPVRLDDGRSPDYCQGLEVGRDGNLYLVCNIPFTDLKSEKGRRIRELRYAATPTESLKKVYEVNLVVVKKP